MMERETQWAALGAPTGSWGDRVLLLIYTPIFAD